MTEFTPPATVLLQQKEIDSLHNPTNQDYGAYSRARTRFGLDRYEASPNLVTFRPRWDVQGDNVVPAWIADRILTLLARLVPYLRPRCFPGPRHNPLVVDMGLLQSFLKKMVLTTISSLLLLATIFALYAIKTFWTRLVLIAIFNILFSVTLNTTTEARNIEIVAATTAFVSLLPSKNKFHRLTSFHYRYAAVQVVFVSSTVNNI
jgi:hypothetical protein